MGICFPPERIYICWNPRCQTPVSEAGFNDLIRQCSVKGDRRGIRRLTSRFGSSVAKSQVRREFVVTHAARAATAEATRQAAPSQVAMISPASPSLIEDEDKDQPMVPTLAGAMSASPMQQPSLSPQANDLYRQEVQRDVMGLVAQAIQRIAAERFQKLEAEQKRHRCQGRMLNNMSPK